MPVPAPSVNDKPALRLRSCTILLGNALRTRRESTAAVKMAMSRFPKPIPSSLPATKRLQMSEWGLQTGQTANMCSFRFGFGERYGATNTSGPSRGGRHGIIMLTNWRCSGGDEG